MEFRILGPLEVEEDGELLPLGGAKQRALIAVLLLNADQVVSTDRLIDALWGEEAPDTAGHTLQVYISQVRKALRSTGGETPQAVLVTRAPGYVLRVDGHELDLRLFEERVAEGRGALAAGDPARAANALAEALDLWRGPALGEFAYERFAQNEIARLDELRLAAIEDRVDADLALGRHAELVGELQTLIAEYPMRERPRAQLMLALYRSDRQGEALNVYQDARRVLTEELGIDPAPALQRLERAILAQDPELDWPGSSMPAYVPTVADKDLGARATSIQTFLMARIRGYPLYTQEQGDEAAAALAARFAALVGETVESRGGSVIELRGDEVLASFGSARAAIRAAVDLQARFVEETVADPALPLPVGIGLDVGEAVPVEGSYRGGAINLAARLGALAGPGEILASREVVHLARRVDGVVPLDRPPIHLEGLPDPVHVVRLRREGWEPAEDIAFRRALGPTTALSGEAAPRLEVANPYKGLRPFEEADAASFFGRESLTEELVARLRGSRFLAVVGPSGSGKSSVVRAGLIPAIRERALPGSDRWVIVDMLPGAHPLEELEASLLRVAVNPPASLIEQLERDEAGLVRAVKRVLPADDGELLLFIDQLEEVFTLVEDEGRRAHFLASIHAAVDDPRGRLRVVTTLRADFYDRPLLYRGFADLVHSHAEAVVPLSPDELERAIVNPAKGVDVGLERGLLSEMLAEVVDQPGALPLMQYALTELFDRREGDSLTLGAYRAIGGVAGALAGRADEVYRALDASGRHATRQLFLRLVTLGEGTEDTRRRVPRAELEDLEVDQRAVARALDVFGASRLLSFDRDARTRRPTVEVAHEALLRAWGRLRGWIEGAREDVRVHRRLAAATTEWIDAAREPSFLLRGGHLAQLESWATTSDIAVTMEEREYLDASLTEREEMESAERERLARELALERRSVNRLRAVVAVLTVAAFVASGLTVVASNQRRRAEEQARIATARQLAGAALANLEADPERSILLALEAVETTRIADGTVLREAEEALHEAVQASRIIERLPARAAAVEFSRDGSRLATAGNTVGVLGSAAPERDTEAIVWDAVTGERLLTLSGHRSRVWDVEFSPDRSLMATGSEDGTAAIWDGETGERLLTLSGHVAKAWVFADFSPDGTRLLTSDGGGSAHGGTVRLWDTRTGELELEWSAGRGVCAIVFSPDGMLAAGALCGGTPGGGALVWDARTGQRVLTLEGHPDYVFDIAWSPDGSRIVTAGIEGDAKVWDSATGDELLTVKHGGLAISAAFSPDGRYVATGSTDGTARVWDAATGSLVHVLSAYGGGGGIGDVEFSPDGRYVLTGGAKGVVSWDISPQGSREEATVVGQDIMSSVAYSPDGTLLLTTSWNGVSTLWDASSGRLVRTFSGHDASFDAAFAPDGTSFVTVGLHGSPVVWDPATGEATRILDVEGFIGSVAVSPDRTLIATAVGGPATQDALVLWDASSGELVETLEEDPGEIDDLEFSPDGALLAGASNLGTATVWEISSGEALRSLSGGDEPLAGVAFSPDGKLVATSGLDETARVWEVATGDLVRSMVGHVGGVADVAFSPDGKLLATAGDDGTERLWDVSTGRELLTLTGHTASVVEVAFSPDGTRLASSSQDATVRIYVLPIGDLIDLARSRLTRTWTEDECRQYLQLPGCPSGV